MAEVNGLVADVPGIVEVGRGGKGHAVALAAEIVELGGGEAAGVVDVVGGGRGGVDGTGSVAGFAADAGFGGGDGTRRSKLQLTGGVALETAHEVGIGGEGWVNDTGGGAMAGSKC